MFRKCILLQLPAKANAAANLALYFLGPKLPTLLILEAYFHICKTKFNNNPAVLVVMKAVFLAMFCPFH